jgi:hypothetical protein
MKIGIFVKLSVLLVVIIASLTNQTRAQSGEPWSQKEIIEPAALALMIKENNAQKPVIYNIGPLANIKGAKFMGAARDNANLEKLKQDLAHVSKDKIVVIYCGCCPFRNCPNIRPAFGLLKEMGFLNPRLLNLSHNLKVDWTDMGYPMD